MSDPRELLERLLPAVNNRDIDALVACFHTDYENVNPIHPQRGFLGNEQVRRNWTQIFESIPDLRARVPRSAVDGDTLWSEWEFSGIRRDGAAAEMRGVFIFSVEGGRAKRARMYLEPVEQQSGDADAFVHTVTVAQS